MSDCCDDCHRAPRRARALGLEVFTLAWTVAEACVGVLAALAAGSVALMGFGLDSVIEAASAGVLVWRLLAERREADPRAIERLDRRAHRIVAALLGALALVVAAEAVSTLVQRERPHPTAIGLVLLAVTIGVMAWLSAAKRRAAEALGSRALHADSFQATACMLLAAIALAGLGLNAAFGWWWADPVAALAMPPLLVREALRAWRGEDCGC